MGEGSSEPDIVQQGDGRRPPLSWSPLPGWRPTRGASVLAALTLVAGLAVGYVVGHGQGRGAATPEPAATQRPVAASAASPVTVAQGDARATFGAPANSLYFLGPALTQDPGTCSVQVGRDIELGIPITNQSPETVLLDSAKPVAPSVGLISVLSWRWDPCGFDSDGIVPDTVVLGPGETTWLTAIVKPLAACPQGSPLQFRVTYSLNGQKTTMSLPGFADLSVVRYSACPGTG